MSKDNTGDMTVESVELEQGLWKRRKLLKFGASEARKAEATLEEQKRDLDQIEHADHIRVLMQFERSPTSESANNKPTGKQVVIEEAESQPQAIITTPENVE